MTFRVDRYLDRRFDKARYNCFDFAREVWKELTGVDLGAQTPEDISISAFTARALFVANSLEKLDAPVDPCLVLMRRARIEPHVGVYYRGRVLHLKPTGVQYMPLDQVTAAYTTITFYR